MTTGVWHILCCIEILQCVTLSSALYCLQICSVMVKPSTQFTPLAEPVASQSLIKCVAGSLPFLLSLTASLYLTISRLLQTTILFRTVSKGYAQLLAPPAVLHLPESASGLDYYHAISPLLPATLLPPDHWTLSLTDAKVGCAAARPPEGSSFASSGVSICYYTVHVALITPRYTLLALIALLMLLLLGSLLFTLSVRLRLPWLHHHTLLLHPSQPPPR